jgi:hypothetical protein
MQRKTIRSLRVRLHSGLRQRGIPPMPQRARHEWGTRVLRGQREFLSVRAIGAGRLLRPADRLLGDFLGGLVGEDGVLVGILGVAVGVGGVLVGFIVVAGFVVLGCGVVGFGGFFVTVGGGAVGFVCHGVSPVTGLSGVGDARAGCVSLA